MDVDIWSDIACPWCYIGKRRFEAALAQFEHADAVRIRWRSFELDPSAPDEREGDRTEGLARKYGIPVERAREMEQNVIDLAAGEGLAYRFDIARSGRTFDAHRLVHLAQRHDLGDAMKERLLRAYFTEGRLMSDEETLVELAVEVGLPSEEARDALASGLFAEEVREDEQLASQIGISGVPTFVVNRRLGVSGAQPPDALLELLRRGWAEGDDTTPLSQAPAD